MHVKDLSPIFFGASVDFFAPWKWYSCTETCRRYVFSICVSLTLCIWLVQ